MDKSLVAHFVKVDGVQWNKLKP